jgi:hypothetical protein
MTDETGQAARSRHGMLHSELSSQEARRVALLGAGAVALALRSMEPGHADKPATMATFFTVRWLCFHIVTWVLATVMVALGWWQLGVSNAKHFDLQNFGYWIQWWLFALFAIFCWTRAIMLARRPPADVRTDGIAVRSVGSGLAVAGGPAQMAQPSGVVDLVSPSSTSAEPVVYRGYVMPKSSERPVGSHGDSYHDAYNDYLWQVSLGDEDPT